MPQHRTILGIHARPSSNSFSSRLSNIDFFHHTSNPFPSHLKKETNQPSSHGPCLMIPTMERISEYLAPSFLLKWVSSWDTLPHRARIPYSNSLTHFDEKIRKWQPPGYRMVWEQFYETSLRKCHLLVSRFKHEVVWLKPWTIFIENLHLRSFSVLQKISMTILVGVNSQFMCYIYNYGFEKPILLL